MGDKWNYILFAQLVGAKPADAHVRTDMYRLGARLYTRISDTVSRERTAEHEGRAPPAPSSTMVDTARLTIRSFLNSDLDALYDMFNELPVQVGARGGYIAPLPERFKNEIKEWADENLLFGVVVDREHEGRPSIGMICL
ncbi:hypothetical protein EW146_g2188 [Bondarzewia mesenterica]|uniref:Uncharacterized protein n=1 Tax=Bondarzewia mesenterica TaxID=1095465 RepID=A0A4S4M3T4_9AGAM|nr:hypothetical protein EW146_g2188 [Bondarzewia mesenterica]